MCTPNTNFNRAFRSDGRMCHNFDGQIKLVCETLGSKGHLAYRQHMSKESQGIPLKRNNYLLLLLDLITHWINARFFKAWKNEDFADLSPSDVLFLY